jgi:hypothetical protein
MKVYIISLIFFIDPNFQDKLVFIRNYISLHISRSVFLNLNNYFLIYLYNLLIFIKTSDLPLVNLHIVKDFIKEFY